VAVKIRLMRVGKKKQPTYRVVVTDGRSPRDGRFIEIIGQYAPRQDPSFVQIDGDAALGWLRKGAQPTEAVEKLLHTTGVWEQYESERSKPAVTKLSRRGYKTGKVAPGVKAEKPVKAAAEEAPAAAQAPPAADAPAAEEAPAAEDAPAAEEATEAPAAETPAEEAAE
jgi:small subunit ribosomal protein S16